MHIYIYFLYKVHIYLYKVHIYDKNTFYCILKYILKYKITIDYKLIVIYMCVCIIYSEINK